MQQNTEKKERFSLEIDGEEGYKRIFLNYRLKIQKFLRQRVRTEEEAEDLASEVFLDFHQYLMQGNDVQDVRAFLYRLARNSLIDFYRTRKMAFSLEEEIAVELPDSVSLEETLDIKEAYTHLLEHLKGLKEEYQEVMELRYLRQLDIKEISYILGKTEGAVRVLLHRATQALRDVAKKLL